MAAPLVEAKGLVKRYGAAGDSGETAVLRGVDLEIAVGESVAIIGPSGCGKSTLLYILGALVPPTAGQVRFAGAELGALTPDELAALRNQSIGFVFQAHHLLPQCTALENVLIPTLARADDDHAARRQAMERARGLLAEVGLGDRLAHRPAQLSGGECQRVAVVRALITEPRLLLADEPTGSLDAEAADRLSELLCDPNVSPGVALVTVTHSERLAIRMQRTLQLRDGVLTPLEIRA